MSAAFVYAVVPAAFEPPELAGLGEPPAPVRVVRAGELGALVSDLPDEAVPGTRADLEAHAGVLAQVVAAGATVVPMRFGMVLGGDPAVRDELLTARRDELLGLVRELDGKVQFTLKAVYGESVMLREAVASDPEITRLSEATRGRPDAEVRDQKIRLGELVAQAVERRRRADEDAVSAALDPLCERVLVEEPRNERIAAHLQLLVDRAHASDVEAAVGRMAEQQHGRLTFRLVGPLAPWSFADVRLEAPEGSWA